MSITYHIHASILHTDHFEDFSWQSGYWARIVTNDVKEVITTANKMYSKLDRGGKSREPQLIVAIIKNKNEDKDTIIVQKIYNKTYSNLESPSDFIYDGTDLEVNSYDLFQDECECYRDDLEEDDTDNKDDNDGSDGNGDNDDTMESSKCINTSI